MIWFATDITPFTEFATPCALQAVARVGADPRSVTLPSSTSTMIPAVAAGSALRSRRISEPMISSDGWSADGVDDVTGCPAARIAGAGSAGPAVF